MALRADDVNLGRDRVLVELFQSGDHRAFDDLYRRYFQRIYRFCLKRVGDPHEAEELAQEAMVRAYSAMPRLEGDRRFYPWLTVIASRLCVDTHRRRGRTSPTAHVELGVVEGGQQEVVDQVDKDLLAEALTKMSPRHREVLRLREEEGWSYDRIARHLGVGVGTIEALLFRARRALRREFHALAGADGRLAGIPVVGWLLRRAHSLRLRFGDLANQAAPMMAAGAVSVAVVVGGVAVGGMGHTPARPAKAATALPSPEIVMPALAPTAVAFAPIATQPSPPVQGVLGAEDPTGSRVSVSTYDEGRARGKNSQVEIDKAGVYVSLNPTTAFQFLSH